MKGHFQISDTIRCDVLIIGAGGAGLRCAAEILENRPDTNVIALTKVSHPQKSHTATAQGGLAAVDPKDPADRPIFHMFDTWKGSDCMADQNVIQKISEASWQQIIWLENRGMHFSRDNMGNLSKRTFGGHTINFGEAPAYRAVFEADRTGKGILDTAWGETIKRGITFMDQSIAVELLFKDNQCAGCVVFKQKEGKFLRILSKATVLATGGCGQVYKVTTNCRQNTGDGLALVLQAGLPVMDPEAVQFHPTGIVGPGILASETLRSIGGILRNKDLEPFMQRYAPRMKELAPRDLVARAIETEIREGRGVLNPDHKIEHIWIDLRHLPENVHDEQIPEVTGFFKKFVNLNPKTDLCPVRPSVHYHMGGIPTNEFGEVETMERAVVPGLFAVGECAAASFHGFNRLGTNSILELITMGKFAGQRVLEYLNDFPRSTPEPKPLFSEAQFSSYLEAKGKDNLGKIREHLRSTMTEKVGVFRIEKEINKGIEILKELKERAEKTALSEKSLILNPELITRWELDNLLAVAMVIARAALRRKESRGAHYREDYPERLDEFNDHTLIRMPQFDTVETGSRRVDMSIFEARGEHHENFGRIARIY
ncbi:MAG: FAD-binding protein [Deltaproteobacteria bacterium]|nr:FAD-binding protein [Deltaproteobacteria bacterium]MBW2152034.1 FAD-binding protein [Deltaproteobacteria bacterium]